LLVLPPKATVPSDTATVPVPVVPATNRVAPSETSTFAGAPAVLVKVTGAAKVATAAVAAAAKVPSKATVVAKPSTTTTKNSATATVTGLKPGQKVKVTVNVGGK